jgi:hypothetical protein
VSGSKQSFREVAIIQLIDQRKGWVPLPELARFFGIIIRMYAEAGAPHHRPHFHAYYQGEVAIYSVDSIDLIAGSLPRAQQRLVEAWAEIHREELMANWESLQEGHTPGRIEPLH